MTEKQEKILKSALELFAEQGYHVTSTSKVAKRAGVSEGLIFRHFENKEGLLKAILESGKQRIKDLYDNIIMETDPKEVVRRSINLPFMIPESDYGFWKLQYKLKWELGEVGWEKVEPLILALTNAFKKLGYPDAELEAEFLVHTIDNLGGALLKGVISDKESMQQFLVKKYGL